MSKYCYKNTDVLINYFNIHDRGLLNRIERDITDLKLTDLQLKPLKGNFNLTHLKAIHKFIFGDIYPFAGKFRSEDIFKSGTMFAKYYLVNDCIKSLLKQLAAEKRLIEINCHELSGRLAYYMAELNMLHPFCEGNGRAIRELALNAEYEIDWFKLDKSDLLSAMKASATSSNDSLRSLLLKALSEDIYGI